MSESLWKIMGVAGILNVFFPMSFMVDAACEYYQDMILGQQYYIYNQEYPQYYGPTTSCRWVANSPVNSRIVLTCNDVDIPASSNCAGDRLAVSLTGDSSFQDAHNYCGKGTLSLVSDSNSLAVGLFATWYSTGGRFMCTLAAVVAEEQTTTEKPNTCDCGWRYQTRIVGGQETGVNEFPAMAGLVDFSNSDVFCGATIIATKYAVTAAHCLIGRQTSGIGLLVGDHDISTGSDTDAAALYALESFHSHEYYNNSTQENDIAIVKTQNLISFSVRVGPICLPFRYSGEDFSGQIVTALGWGTIEFSGPKSDTLQGVNLTVLGNNECRSRVTNEVIYDSEMCTFTTGKDACQFDSGGPLLWSDWTTNRLHLTGIISHGIACALNSPGINTRVTSFLAWIVQATYDATYCIK